MAHCVKSQGGYLNSELQSGNYLSHHMYPVIEVVGCCLSVLISDSQGEIFPSVLPFFLVWQNGGIVNVRNTGLSLSVDYAKM